MIDLVSLETRVAPNVMQILESPAVKQDLELAASTLTSYIVEVVEEEASKQGLSALIGRIIIKIKGVFKMSNENTNTTATDTTTTTDTGVNTSQMTLQ
jgi:preprotein translocase subunit SecB